MTKILLKKEFIKNFNEKLSTNIDICHLCMNFLENFEFIFILSKCPLILKRYQNNNYIHDRYKKEIGHLDSTKNYTSKDVLKRYLDVSRHLQCTGLSKICDVNDSSDQYIISSIRVCLEQKYYVILENIIKYINPIEKANLLKHNYNDLSLSYHIDNLIDYPILFRYFQSNYINKTSYRDYFDRIRSTTLIKLLTQYRDLLPPDLHYIFENELTSTSKNSKYLKIILKHDPRIDEYFYEVINIIKKLNKKKKGHELIQFICDHFKTLKIFINILQFKELRFNDLRDISVCWIKLCLNTPHSHLALIEIFNLKDESSFIWNFMEYFTDIEQIQLTFL